MLKQYPDNHGARFGIFLCAFSMALSYLAVNLATNSLPFGSDVSALFPRWMTIRRGQFICTILGIAIVPWKLLNNAAAFLTFLVSLTPKYRLLALKWGALCRVVMVIG